MTPLVLIVALSILILIHEAGHFFMARWLGVQVDRFSIGFGRVLFRWRRGQTEYCLSLLPLGGYVKLAGEQAAGTTGARWEFGSRPVGQRAGIIVAGPLVNYMTGILLFILIFWAGHPTLAPQIGTILPGYPAAASGLQPQDLILRVNHIPVESWEMVTDLVRRQTSGAPLALVVQRGGVEQTLLVRPKVKTGRTIFGRSVKVAVVGMLPAGGVRIVRYPVDRAIVEGVRRTWWLTTMTYQSLWQMATGALSMKESLTGPVGIFYLTSSAAQMGWRYLVQLFAVLSVSLALFNLLPIPVLDGGHLVFLGWERLRRRPVSVRVQEVMTQAGMCLLLGLLFLVTYNDLVKFQVIQRLADLFR